MDCHGIVRGNRVYGNKKAGLMILGGWYLTYESPKCITMCAMAM